jgi:hypothetical protein
LATVLEPGRGEVPSGSAVAFSTRQKRNRKTLVVRTMLSRMTGGSESGRRRVLDVRRRPERRTEHPMKADERRHAEAMVAIGTTIEMRQQRGRRRWKG